MTDRKAALVALKEAVEAGKMTEFDIVKLRRFVAYDPETGKMLWKERMSNRVRAGSPALSSPKSSGHLHGMICGVPMQAHRAAWAIHHGEWPKGYIDHINGVRNDNRMINLRVVSMRENALNRRINSKKQSSLPHGVSVKDNGRFFAQIQLGKKNHHLGYYGTAAEAAQAYNAAKDRLGFHENHGSPPILAALIAQEEA